MAMLGRTPPDASGADVDDSPDRNASFHAVTPSARRQFGSVFGFRAADSNSNGEAFVSADVGFRPKSGSNPRQRVKNAEIDAMFGMSLVSLSARPREPRRCVHPNLDGT
ncbi:hypothetical protein [Roseateles aquatilis]|uniref:hypothetical protein n=1 Tax=Roseateles aquatilis TaxID=431061 RepID=UPI001131D6F3|nr:hypothetical protein [Roseateles aquatilis]